MSFLVVFLLGVASALPYDPVIVKDPGLRYQYVQGPDGAPHLVDSWVKASDYAKASRYDADLENVYHLFTRNNPTLSQPLLIGGENLLSASSYDPLKRTIVLIHGWMNSASSDVNAVIANAYLTADDVNVVVVDWSAGAGTIDYLAAVVNTVTSGEAVARFINWLNSVTGASSSMYHIVGHSLGGQQAGIVGRNLAEAAAYITALDPAFPGWLSNDDKFRSDDGAYTEVIHTNAGLLGYISNLGHVDFYPNGGVGMPGCSSPECDHARSYFYMAESIISGGFTANLCSSYITAMAASCPSSETLQMGGLVPKTGSTGVYYLTTNAAPPFSTD